MLYRFNATADVCGRHLHLFHYQFCGRGRTVPDLPRLVGIVDSAGAARRRGVVVPAGAAFLRPMDHPRA